MTISIVLGDDHGIVREGVRLLLERQPTMRVVGEADNGHDAVQLVRTQAPNVAVLDINMPGMNGLDATRLLRQECPQTRVVILSMYSDDNHVMDALAAGALGYVLKSAASRELVAAVQSVSNRHIYLSSTLAGEVDYLAMLADSHRQSSSLLGKLSPREREILQLVVEGHSSADIATLLGLSSATVDTYRSRLMAKLHITNVPALVLFAVRNGLISVDH